MTQNLLELNETTDDQLVIIREFTAPKTLVFEVLTKHEHIIKWSCPNGMTVSFSEGVLKVGEKYRFGMESPDGAHKVVLTGEYQEIQQPDKLVYTQAYTMPDGSTNEETLITIRLEEIGNKTQMIFHQNGFTSAAGRDNAIKGWNEAFDKIENLLENLLSK